MRIEYEGETYDFEFDDITVKQAIKIEKFLGCPIAEFGSKLQPTDGNPDMQAMQVLGWLILHGGRGIPIEDTDFKLRVLVNAVAAASAAESEPEEVPAADPTADAGPSPNGSGTLEGQLTAL